MIRQVAVWYGIERSVRVMRCGVKVVFAWVLLWSCVVLLGDGKVMCCTAKPGNGVVPESHVLSRVGIVRFGIVT